ncbi:MAG: TetR/AcrR family transcriptional regulator [Planctomycetota bacterium]|nr:TetR/AcrR family transcriptional regulator [Planctomycetota bacterium]
MKNLLDELTERDGDERKRLTRRRIVRAATEAIVRHGYRRASVDSIARTAGIAKGTIYLYFPSKVDLLVGVLRSERRQQLEQLLPKLRRDLAPEVRLRVWLEEELRTRARMPVTALAISGEDEVRAALEQVEPAARGRLLGIAPAFVEHLVRAGPWAEEGVSERVAVLLAVVYAGVPEERLRGGLSPDQFAITLARLLVEGISGAPAATAPPSPWF